MNRKEINIGLFGFGCVGNGLHKAIQSTPGLNASIKRICVKDKSKKRQISASHFTYRKNDILEDESINTVVELIDDADAAFDIVKTALQKGKAVVTANKKMIAEHFDELIHLQRQNNVPLLYEAACSASIPIIRNLEEYYDNDLLESVEGIVNGSTNYILSKIANEEISYEKALHEAQQNGYAESNPIMDTGGFDAKFKLTILIAHAFGLVVDPSEIFNIGIDKLGELELNYAKEKGYKIKLVAFAEKTIEGKIIAFVLPKFVKNNDNLYGVEDVFNGIKTKSSLNEMQFFLGKGAGAFPTASAVLSDISALSYDYRYEYKKLNNTDVLENESDILLKIFLRHELSFSTDFKKYFNEINESYQNHSNAYIIGVISLKNLKVIEMFKNTLISVVLFNISNTNLLK
ncbi:MAG: homoserine dehydrogenase [Flavobacteriia bacterium]|nr:homoserine dehydrogenase [Flavobacteriia bacterium]